MQVKTLVILVGSAIVLTACGRSASQATQASVSVAASTPTIIPSPTPQYRYAQLLDRDDIKPIYNPEFASADQVKLSDDDIVLGVVIDGEAKAYPIRVLNYTEMVNDELAGIPILATW